MLALRRARAGALDMARMLASRHFSTEIMDIREAVADRIPDEQVRRTVFAGLRRPRFTRTGFLVLRVGWTGTVFSQYLIKPSVWESYLRTTSAPRFSVTPPQPFAACSTS